MPDKREKIQGSPPVKIISINKGFYMLFKKLVEYSSRVRKVSSRNTKIAIISTFLARLKREEAEIGVNFIAGGIRQGKLNLAWKGLSQLMEISSNELDRPPQLAEIDRFLEQTKAVRGMKKVKILYPLFQRLNAREKKYLVSLILGEVQQGAGEGLVKMAIARFFNSEDSDIERAYMHIPDIGKLFVYLLEKGKSGIHNLGVKVFTPVKPMLAQIADSVEDMFREYDDFALEHKLDGIRIQVHKKSDAVKIFSRHLKDITVHFPELVEVAHDIPVDEFILDGEAIGIDEQGKPLPFQILAKRTTRKRDINRMREKICVIPQFFDVLYSEGTDVTSNPYAERWKILSTMIKSKDYLAPRALPLNKDDGKKFFEHALVKGSEGIMVKLLNSSYSAGKRGKFWFKIKRAHTIDCVILAAEWGHGRRTGWLSNLHLGILNETRTKYLMVGKTFKGLTDTMMKWLTENLRKIKVHEDSWTVYVKPEIVVEVAFNEAQKSPRYDSGLALRFARVKQIRQDKGSDEINTILDLQKFTLRGGKYEL